MIHIKLRVQLIILTNLQNADAFEGESIRFLNMASDLLSIKMRVIHLTADDRDHFE